MFSFFFVEAVMAQNKGNQSENSNLQDPMKPDSKKVLDEKELQKAIKYVAQRIEKLKPQYPHLKNFNENTALSGTPRIWYQNNIKQKLNPEYEKEIAKRKTQPTIKMPLPGKTISYYPEKDGIDLYISFTSYDEYTMSQRIWLPDLWIGNFAVELIVKGKKTPTIKKLHKSIFDILTSTKKQIEK